MQQECIGNQEQDFHGCELKDSPQNEGLRSMDLSKNVLGLIPALVASDTASADVTSIVPTCWHHAFLSQENCKAGQHCWHVGLQTEAIILEHLLR